MSDMKGYMKAQLAYDNMSPDDEPRHGRTCKCQDCLDAAADHAEDEADERRANPKEYP